MFKKNISKCTSECTSLTDEIVSYRYVIGNRRLLVN